MAINVAATREALAVEYGSQAPYAALHSADPGTGLTNEATGGSPAYARKALTWSAGASDGVVTASATFDLAPNQAVTHAALCTAATGGAQVDKVAITYATQASQSTLTVNFTMTIS